MSPGSDPEVLLGRYELGEVIGSGGMGEVRAARDLVLDRPVAIKFLRAHLDPDDQSRARFLAEARAAARLIHPNIVPVFDSGEEEGVPFIVMERLSGRTLADRVAEGPAGEGEARRLTLEILSALGTSHEEGILHRDLKPGNVMLTEEGSAKVADFGIAKSTEGIELTTTGLTLGTPAYLAPERIAGEPAGEASDVYSVGVILYELLTGRKPFEADTPLAMVRTIQEERPAALADLRPDVDPELVAIVERAMAKNPARRYSSAREMERELQDWVPALETDDTHALSGSTAALRLHRKGSSRRRRRLAAILIGVLAVAWPVYVARSTSPPESPAAAPSPSASAVVVPIAPQLEQALGFLDGVLVQTGTAEAMRPLAQELRNAAQFGDRLKASEQLQNLRSRTRLLVDEGVLAIPSAEAIEAALFQVDLQIGTIYPPSPAAPAPPSPSPAAPAPPPPA